ncbi:Cof-type HAD-IIB family hydrolase [Aquimarina sp. 2201CG5-10]|uniref:Cof-type HAD-IIB family hydrolase n=1 Tax=Aquimarina callyspongiae TaxID=3098150 RepID=UPI002AB38908|nr:Cof-type HAD-IIB family hydrolase [Aquimarina sp. 2201CG5-10]MDY8137889.1 Cof-type HAD-IIB family hydrolase [Aquimarina sp. 2201CG5-10]
MPHRLVFSDIDGTLLNPERELSEFTISEIKRIKNTIPVVLISSRMPSAMIHLQKELDITDQPLICYNGGLILVDQKPIHSTFIAPDIIAELHQFNIKRDIHISLYHNDDWFVPEMDFWANRESNNTKVNPVVKPTDEVILDWKNNNKGAHKIMCMGDEQYIDLAFTFLSDNFGDLLHLYRSKPTYIEIAHKNISKLTAIEMLLDQHFKIPISDVVAFGDNYNDIAMIKAVGTGVAVANAKPETIEIADIITLPGKEDGVATYIKNHIK